MDLMDLDRLTVTLRLDSGQLVRVEPPGWHEVSPELAVTPVLAGWPDPQPIPGWWRVTHIPTGRALCPPCCRGCATAVGQTLSALPVPWEQLTAEQAATQLAQLPDAAQLRHTIRLLITAASRCPHNSGEGEI